MANSSLTYELSTAEIELTNKHTVSSNSPSIQVQRSRPYSKHYPNLDVQRKKRSRRKFRLIKLTLCLAVLIPLIWGAGWAGVVTAETEKMISTKLASGRVAGVSWIPVGWTPIWCRADNDCEPFEENANYFAQNNRFNISVVPNRHALHVTELYIRNNDNPDPSTFNPWQKWGFSYPFDHGVALTNFPRSLNSSMEIHSVLLSGFLMNVYIALELSNMTECLALPDGACNDLQVVFGVSRWSLVKAVVVIVGTVNWIVAIALCIITAIAINNLFENRKAGKSVTTELLSVLAAQFGAIFTLPGLRQILPSAPAFGCGFDLVAIVPTLTLVALCGGILLIVVLLQRFQSPGIPVIDVEKTK